MIRRLARVPAVATCLTLTAAAAAAHDGPPFPIVSDQRTGAYVVSVWTDPDTTDDATPGGQFWVMLALHGQAGEVLAETRVSVTATPLERPGDPVRAEAPPVRNQSGTHFGAVVLDHEGRFRIQVEIDGPAGSAVVDGEVDATYDLRPPPAMLVLYLAPFVVVGILWAKLLLRRRSVSSGSAKMPRLRE
jgi:hypothetical protein